MSPIEHSIQSKDTCNILPWIYYSCLYEEKNQAQKLSIEPFIKLSKMTYFRRNVYFQVNVISSIIELNSTFYLSLSF